MPLAAILAGIDVAQLSGYDRIVVLRAHRKMASHYDACAYQDMASVVDSMHGGDDGRQAAAESAAAEIRAALRLTRRAADAELGFALDLRERLPVVWRSLASGAIDVRRAKTIAYGTAHLSDAAAGEVASRIIERAPELTTGQLAARIRSLCFEADPDEAEQRYADAVEERRVVAQATESGTAHLMGLDLPPHRVAAATRRITRLAQALKTSSEVRTMDQLQADVIFDLLLRTPRSERPGRKGVVDIRVSIGTLAGLDEMPGELGGFGPVIADIARQVVDEQRDAEWRFTVTHPDTGLAMHTGTTRRRPSAEQRRAVESRDTTCVFPGCRMPAVACDLDHRVLYSEVGRTSVDDLAPLCRHDHGVRHKAGWRHVLLANGDHRWTTKLGHSYTTSGKPP